MIITFLNTGKKTFYSMYSVAQSCPTLCDPMDCRLPGCYVYGSFVARILEWVVISSSTCISYFTLFLFSPLTYKFIRIIYSTCFLHFPPIFFFKLTLIKILFQTFLWNSIGTITAWFQVTKFNVELSSYSQSNAS